MLRRASVLSERARERIRAAREHDPHAWLHPHTDAPADDHSDDHFPWSAPPVVAAGAARPGTRERRDSIPDRPVAGVSADAGAAAWRA